MNKLQSNFKLKTNYNDEQNHNPKSGIKADFFSRLIANDRNLILGVFLVRSHPNQKIGRSNSKWVKKRVHHLGLQTLMPEISDSSADQIFDVVEPT